MLDGRHVLGIESYWDRHEFTINCRLIVGPFMFTCTLVRTQLFYRSRSSGGGRDRKVSSWEHLRNSINFIIENLRVVDTSGKYYCDMYSKINALPSSSRCCVIILILVWIAINTCKSIFYSTQLRLLCCLLMMVELVCTRCPVSSPLWQRCSIYHVNL